MFLKILFILLILPIIEIFILMQLSSLFGPLTAIILIVGTGFFGASIAKIQGIQAVNRIRDNMKQGIMPGDEVVDAFLIFSGGVLLIIPGLISDVAGIMLLAPSTRKKAANYLTRELNRLINNGTLRFKKF